MAIFALVVSQPRNTTHILMNAKLYALLPLLGLLVYTSCSSEADPSFTLSTTTDIELYADEGAYKTFSFTSAREWLATSSDSWLTLSQTSGEAGTYTLRLICADTNDTGSTRTATVTLTSVDLVKTVSVVQDPILVIEDEEIDVGAEGLDSLYLYFDVNISDINNLYIYYGPSWLIQGNSLRTTRSMDTYYLLVSIPENTGSSSRTGYFLFCLNDDLDDLVGQINIVQEGVTAGTSSDYSYDGTVVTLQTASKGSGLPIVLMGDGFIDTEIEDGTYEEVMNQAMENLFTEEPMTSLREYFDVYYVVAVSENNMFGEGYSTAFSCELEGGSSTYIEGDDDAVLEYIEKIDGIDAGSTLAVVILNTTTYAGTTWFNYYINGKRTELAIAYCPTIYGRTHEYFREVLVHEAVGHGFAKLADEYYYSGTISKSDISTVQRMQTSVGWYMNIDFTDSTDDVLWSAFIADSTYTGEGIGIYEGAYGYVYGVYRPTDDSMMNSNTIGFNAPSREEIYLRVMEEGAGLSPTHEDFVAFDIETGMAGQPLTNKYTSSLKSRSTSARPQFHVPQFEAKTLNSSRR